MVLALKKTKCCARLKNGIVKIHPGFPSNSPQGFAKDGPTESPENAPTHVRPTRVPETTQSENINIPLYREQKSMQKQRKRDPPGSARETPFGLLKCMFYPPKNIKKGIKMKPLKRAQDLPQNHLHVFQKAASREYPKTRPKRVLRDAPTGPLLKTSLFH